jgi:hypothetical protein
MFVVCSAAYMTALRSLISPPVVPDFQNPCRRHPGSSLMPTHQGFFSLKFNNQDLSPSVQEANKTETAVRVRHRSGRAEQTSSTPIATAASIAAWP